MIVNWADLFLYPTQCVSIFDIVSKPIRIGSNMERLDAEKYIYYVCILRYDLSI